MPRNNPNMMLDAASNILGDLIASTPNELGIGDLPLVVAEGVYIDTCRAMTAINKIRRSLDRFKI